MMRLTENRSLITALLLVCGTTGASADGVSWCDIPAQGLTPSATLQKSLSLAQTTAPSPRTTLRTEGSLPSDPVHKASQAARKDLPRMLNTALNWRITQNPQALAQTKVYLQAWVNTYQPSYNPIDETNFDALFETYAIISPTLTSAESSAIRPYLRNWAKGYISRIDAAGSRARVTAPPTVWNNNWQSHRIKLVTMMATALGDDQLFVDARRLFRQQVTTNINGQSGEVLDFARRDAIHYVIFDLDPLIQAALAAQARGEDWYHWTAPTGASLDKAMNWLRPYATGQKTHDEFVNSQVAFDAKRAAAGMKGFSGKFDPTIDADIYWYAAKFDPSFQSIAKSLQPVPPVDMQFCGR